MSTLTVSEIGEENGPDDDCGKDCSDEPRPGVRIGRNRTPFVLQVMTVRAK
jgi:hypothetical protein